MTSKPSEAFEAFEKHGRVRIRLGSTSPLAEASQKSPCIAMILSVEPGQDVFDPLQQTYLHIRHRGLSMNKRLRMRSLLVSVTKATDQASIPRDLVNTSNGYHLYHVSPFRLATSLEYARLLMIALVRSRKSRARNTYRDLSLKPPR